MAFENFTAARQHLTPPKINWMPLVAGILFFALSAAVGYIIWYKNQTIDAITQHEKTKATLVAVDTTRENELQRKLNETNLKYEMLKVLESQKDSSCNDNSLLQNKELEEKKMRISFLLNKVNLTQDELNEAKNLIASLKGEIKGYKAQVETLSGEKVTLIQENQVAIQKQEQYRSSYDSAVAAIRDQQDLLDIGSTLVAYNFSITSIQQKTNGREKATVNANKVDKLRIAFELGENRITETGTQDIYVCITDPHGLPISVEAYGSGKFATRSGKDKFFTQKVDVSYTKGTRQTVSFDWKQNTMFEPGNYKIEVYNNGFKIGEGVRSLKKGGQLF